MVRFKVRYLVFQIFHEDELVLSLTNIEKLGQRYHSTNLLGAKPFTRLTSNDLFNLIKEHVQINFGDWGYGLIMSSLNIKYYSPITCMGILRISRKHYRLVWAVLTFLLTLHNQRAVIRVLGVHGTMKSAETFLIQYNQHQLLQLR